MTENSRNIAVGLTVLVGLCMLGGLILAFTGLPEIFQTGNTVYIFFDRTHDITPGDPIYLRGKQVGRVTDVGFTDNDPRMGITIAGRIDSDILLPRNVQAKVFTKGFTGKGYLSFIPDGPLPVDPETGKKIEFYSPDQTITLKGVHDPGAGILPPELREAFESFGRLAENLNQLLEPEPTTTQPTTTAATGPAEPPPGLSGTIGRLNRTLDALHALAGGAENQANLKASLANFAQASAKAAEAMDALKNLLAKGQKTLAGTDELTRKLITDAEDIATLLTAVRQSVEKINTGEGTAGKLLNDPKLYDNLVHITEQMAALIEDFRLLAKKWEKQGMGIKLK